MPRLGYLEGERYHYQRTRILAALREGPVNSRQLSAIALRYSSRIHELRQRGYTITLRRHAGKGFVYTLHETARERVRAAAAEPAWIREGVR
jgi:hypothetical protein